MHALGFGPFNMGGWEWMAILVVLLLLFGRRLPEVGRSLGRGIVEFRKGIKGIEDEIESESDKSSSSARPPLTEGGQDPRVSRSDAVHSEPGQGESRGGQVTT